MKKSIFSGIILFTSFLSVNSSNIKNDYPEFNDYDCYITVTAEIEVVDEEALAPKINELEKSIQSKESEFKCEDLVKEINSNEETIRQVDYFLGFDKKLKEKEDKVRLDSLVQVSKPIPPENVKKDAKKGKLSEPVINYLKRIKQSLTQENEKLNGTIKNMQQILLYDIDYLNDELTSIKNACGKTKDQLLVEERYEHRNIYEFPYKWVIGEKSIKNPNRRSLNQPYQINSHIDRVQHMLGWEWIDYTDYTTETTYYPVNITYRKYNKINPNLRIIGDVAYDNDGNLVRVLSLTGKETNWSDILEGLKKACDLYVLYLVRQDYDANKYNIKNEGKDVTYALDNLLGVSNAFAKQEEKRLKPYLTEMENALKSGNGRKYNELRNKYATIIYGPAPNDPKNNSTATKFINQCKKDHANDELRIWKIERLDDITFKVIFLNKPNTETREMTLKFKNSAPYKVNFEIIEGDQWKDKNSGHPFDASPYMGEC